MVSAKNTFKAVKDKNNFVFAEEKGKRREKPKFPVRNFLKGKPSGKPRTK